MSITPGHFTLTPEQRRFKELLSGYPRLQAYWDFDKRDCDLDALTREMGVLSHSEQHMARFFAAVWLGENRLSFDLIDAAKTLDDTHRQVILNWLADPAFP